MASQSGIMNLNAWAEKTAQAVRRICSKKNAPCVGFSLVFCDPTAPEDERWNYTIELAFDPHDPPTEEQQKEMQRVFEFINEGIKKLMGGDDADFFDAEDFSAKVNWN